MNANPNGRKKQIKLMLLFLAKRLPITALNGRLYARMENGEEILITRRYAKEIEDCFMEDDDDERI